jgi:solute carrier family 25 thiamine pyrophosphate transporter 19
MAGIVAKTLFMPLDVIRKRLQVQGPVRREIIVSNVPKYTGGLFQSIIQIFRHEGLMGLYKGWVPSILKAGPSSAVTFFVLEAILTCKLDAG